MCKSETVSIAIRSRTYVLNDSLMQVFPPLGSRVFNTCRARGRGKYIAFSQSGSV